MIRAALILAIAAIALPARAQPSEPERLYLEGQQAYDGKRYDGALVAWTRSYELSRLPALLFNIAQAYRLRGLPGDCAKASDAYRRFIAADPSSPQRAAADGFIVELAPCAAPAVPAGPSAQPPAPAPTPQTRETREGRAGGSGLKLAAYVTGGASLVAIATGAYFGTKASSIGDEITAACKTGCDWNAEAKRDAEGRSAERTQWILYGVGAAGLAVGGTLYLLGAREQAGAVAVVPRAGGGAAVTWSGSW